MDRRRFMAAVGAGLAGTMTNRLFGQEPVRGAGDSSAQAIDIDVDKVVGELPHFWEKAAGSDHTVQGLRDQWRKDLVRAHRDTGIQSIRCHGLFDDDMGIAAAGAGKFNFLYVDQVYDYMLDLGVRPFVELSFMPEAFASGENTICVYKGNTSPPKNWQDWHDMVQAFTDHCVKRYGLNEVRGWKFEVWNEPNISFWAGTQEQYFELYRQSALAIKAVDSKLQVGGPSTAMLAWVPDLIKYCVSRGLPLDFVSTHIYPNDPQKDIFGRDNMYPYEEVIPRGLKQVKQQIEASAMPGLPLWITEWSSQNPAFIAGTIKNCIGLVEAMSYWTFSNVFEEGGVPHGLFNRNFGMTEQWGIARPSLHAFAFLLKLGNQQIHTADGPVLATRRADGSIAIVIWNLIPDKDGSGFANGNPMDASAGATRIEGKDLTLRLRLNGLPGNKQARISQVNGRVGTAIPAWKAMGSPQYPSREQINQLRAAAEVPKPETLAAIPGRPNEFSIALPPNGLALLELE